MKVLVFRTDIKSKKKVKAIKPHFNKLTLINKWSVDLEDIDNVLRIESAEPLREVDVINLVNECGFHCETLTY